jgi:serine protease Do
MASVRSLAALSVLTIAVLGGADALAAGPLPPLPGGKGAEAAPGAPASEAAAHPDARDDASASDPGSAAPSPLERVRRGVVLIERDGRLLGFGTVLANDGRVLTALSTVTGGAAAGNAAAPETANIRYADGTVVPAKLGHKDAAWDLALLVPRSAHWKDGLAASASDPAQIDLRAPVPPRAGAKPIALPVHFKGRTDALSRAGDSLLDALEVEIHHALPIAGAPILDPSASVVGVLVHACKLTAATGAEAAKSGPIACAPTIIGAPVSAVRSFLMKTPAAAATPTPWLGIAGEPDESGTVHGVRVMAVAPQSPAQKAGLQAAEHGAPDRIIAVDGKPVDTPEKLADAIAKHAIGDTVKLLVLGPPAKPEKDGDAPSFREVAVVLRAAP